MLGAETDLFGCAVVTVVTVCPVSVQVVIGVSIPNVLVTAFSADLDQTPQTVVWWILIIQLACGPMSTLRCMHDEFLVKIVSTMCKKLPYPMINIPKYINSVYQFTIYFMCAKQDPPGLFPGLLGAPCLPSPRHAVDYLVSTGWDCLGSSSIDPSDLWWSRDCLGRVPVAISQLSHLDRN